jgi:tetratricopeptide (TPR) repeat protein
LKDHPRPDVLERFLLGKLEKPQSRRVVLHLLAGCDLCREAMAPLAGVLLRPESPPELRREEVFSPGREYDAALDRALEAIQIHGVHLPQRRRETEDLVHTIATNGLDEVDLSLHDRYSSFEALLKVSQRFRHDDPEQMLHFAWSAKNMARRLADQGFSKQQVYDFEARAEGELGNAYRVADRLLEAEVHLDQAFCLASHGSGSVWLKLRLQDLRASLLKSRHRYQEAIFLLDEVRAGYLEAGDRHNAGRALMTKAMCFSYLSEPDQALAILSEAETLFDPVREPELARLAKHNRLFVLADAGQLEAALQTLEDHRDLLEESGRFDRCRLLGIEGRIAAGMGMLELAEDVLEEAKAGFETLKVGFHAAVAGLDLAAVVLRLERSEEAYERSLEAFEAFGALRIPDQQVEALLVLAEAMRARSLTVGLLQSVTDFLRRARHDPNARFEARPS